MGKYSKVYVCALCLGKGKVEVMCMKCHNGQHGLSDSPELDECDAGGEVFCPTCTLQKWQPSVTVERQQ